MDKNTKYNIECILEDYEGWLKSVEYDLLNETEPYRIKELKNLRSSLLETIEECESRLSWPHLFNNNKYFWYQEEN